MQIRPIVQNVMSRIAIARFVYYTAKTLEAKEVALEDIHYLSKIWLELIGKYGLYERSTVSW